MGLWLLQTEEIPLYPPVKDGIEATVSNYYMGFCDWAKSPCFPLCKGGRLPPKRTHWVPSPPFIRGARGISASVLLPES